MNQVITNQNKVSRLIEAVESAAAIEPVKASVRPKSKGLASSRALKRHLRYIVPEMRLALIKEPGIKPKAITSAEDLDKFIEPLKFYSEEHFVSFHLSVKFEVVGFQIVSRGSLSAFIPSIELS